MVKWKDGILLHRDGVVGGWVGYEISLSGTTPKV